MVSPFELPDPAFLLNVDLILWQPLSNVANGMATGNPDIRDLQNSKSRRRSALSQGSCTSSEKRLDLPSLGHVLFMNQSLRPKEWSAPIGQAGSYAHPLCSRYRQEYAIQTLKNGSCTKVRRAGWSKAIQPPYGSV